MANGRHHQGVEIQEVCVFAHSSSTRCLINALTSMLLFLFCTTFFQLLSVGLYPQTGPARPH